MPKVNGRMQDEDNLHWQRDTAAYTQKRGQQYTTSVGRIAASSSILSEYSFIFASENVSLQELRN